jgi:hypothetical protein
MPGFNHPEGQFLQAGGKVSVIDKAVDLAFALLNVALVNAINDVHLRFDVQLEFVIDFEFRDAGDVPASRSVNDEASLGTE